MSYGLLSWGLQRYALTPYSIGRFGRGGATATEAPTNVSAPIISGDLQLGDTLSSTKGTWTQFPSSYTYQWQRDSVNIVGATAKTYVVASADEDTDITCDVTATNSFGSTLATSNSLVIPEFVAPVNTIAPAIAGDAEIPSLLSSTTGTWDNVPDSYTHQWQRDSVNIAGATSNTYTTTSSDNDSDITCDVTATNIYGSAEATSNTIVIPDLVPVNTVAPVVTVL